jgi:hypothetical protein
MTEEAAVGAAAEAAVAEGAEKIPIVKDNLCLLGHLLVCRMMMTMVMFHTMTTTIITSALTTIETKLQPLPIGQAFQAWRMSTIQTTIAAAGRQGDNALGWTLLADKADSVDELNIPGRDWVSLGRKLASAVTKIAHGELGRQIALMNSTAIDAGRIARGRRLLQLVFHHYSSRSSAELMYDASHLQRIILKNDQIETFQRAGLFS